MAKKLAISLIVFNVVALGLLIKDHPFTRPASAAAQASPCAKLGKRAVMWDTGKGDCSDRADGICPPCLIVPWGPSPLPQGVATGLVYSEPHSISLPIQATTQGFVEMTDLTRTTQFPNAPLAVTFNAEAFASCGTLLKIRAKLDDEVLAPGEVILTGSPHMAVHSFTFVEPVVAAGTHTVKFEYMLTGGGTSGWPPVK
jgi:hypothetical protein